jgi:1-acyl-sn-glycerol-3-phosphate acyltransferase
LFDRYPTEPYRFIPPRRSNFWGWVSRQVIPYHLRRSMNVVRLRFESAELLRESVGHGAGVLLAPNHCRWADPMVVGLLGASVGQYLYYVAAYHLFRQGRVMSWVMNRFGGYSIWREGVDRESIRATVRILAQAERPVVLFPEGTWFRQNDRVGALQEGLGLIARQAAKQSERPLVVHPVGIKYWLLEDPRPELRRRLGRLERRIGWQPQDHLDLLPRVEKLGGALLAIKEIELHGCAQAGDLDERVRRLVDSHVLGVEKRYGTREHDGSPLERIRRLRQLLVRQLPEVAADAERLAEVRRSLDLLLFCENLNAQSLDYLRQAPTPERLTETVQRIEETVSDDIEVPVGPIGAVAAVGPALDARAFAGTSRGPDPLVARLRGALQDLVDRLVAAGPPAEWDCPPATAER